MTKSTYINLLAILCITSLVVGFIVKPTIQKANHTYTPSFIKITPTYANHFDFPVGKPDAKGYYNAQKFGENNHLGDDWNGNGGGNTDLGDTIYSIANGYLNSAEDNGIGWGNVIVIVHYLEDGTSVASLYAHCDSMFVSKKQQFIKRGEPIGTIGTAGGMYPAHLHFEMRSDINLGIGGGYSSNSEGYIDPTAFINAHR